MISTPYYLIDKSKIQRNMEKISMVRERSGAKALLALKCFAAWSLFDFMRPYMDGTTSSSLNELRLGHDRFGKETQAYSVAYSDEEIDTVASYADKIIFNSVGQLERFASRVGGIPRGLRLNPQISSSNFDLADPARRFSRLGEWDMRKVEAAMDHVSGFMIHNNSENNSFAVFSAMLDQFELKFSSLLHKVDWISLGGGFIFTSADYPLDEFCDRLERFQNRYQAQVYLEPGEASITQSTTLETTVLDTFYNEKHIAIVDSSVEAHMLDLLIYRASADLTPNAGKHAYMICGNSCLAGDVFGEFRFQNKLEIGDRVTFQDAAVYTMVKKNWFNGVKMPSIAIRELDGSINLIKEFDYFDYEQSLS